MILKGKKLLFMAGGTGGHVYPALAVARAAAEQGSIIHWLGNQSGFEGKKVPEAGFIFHDIAVYGLRGNGVIGWLKAPFMIGRAVFQAKKIMQHIQPDVVIGMGGFASGPGGVAAKILNIPLLIHEQNAVMGLTNALLSRVANTILLASQQAAAKIALKYPYRVTGNPVREDITLLPAPEERFRQRSGKIRLLVLGGSQGAKAINLLLPQALSLLSEEQRPQVLHQTGARWLEKTQTEYAALNVQAEIVPFIDDMAKAYANADWVIARSGALTVSEIATAGLAALFIPFPYAVDDHQTMNAQCLAEVGAAAILEEKILTADILATAIQSRQDRSALLTQAERARLCSDEKALGEILRAIKELCR